MSVETVRSYTQDDEFVNITVDGTHDLEVHLSKPIHRTDDPNLNIKTSVVSWVLGVSPDQALEQIRQSCIRMDDNFVNYRGKDFFGGALVLAYNPRRDVLDFGHEVMLEHRGRPSIYPINFNQVMDPVVFNHFLEARLATYSDIDQVKIGTEYLRYDLSPEFKTLAISGDLITNPANKPFSVAAEVLLLLEQTTGKYINITDRIKLRKVLKEHLGGFQLKASQAAAA